MLDRDGRRCTLRIEGVCTYIATQVHHLVAREVAGDDPMHLTASCAPCNLHVGDPRRHDPPPAPREWWR